MNLKSTSLRLRLTASALLVTGIVGLGLGMVGVTSAATPAAPTAAALSAGPVTVINSVTDPAGAAAARNRFDADSSTDKAFTPISEPTFAVTGFEPPGDSSHFHPPPADYSTTLKNL